MLLRVGKMVLAADDVGDVHLDVVDHVDEMENGRAVLALDDEVGLVGAVELDVAADQIGHGDRRLRRAELDRAVRLVGLALGQKPVDVAFINRAALALEIRALVALDRAARLRAFVPVRGRATAAPWKITSTYSGLLRAASVSSMRRMKVPPVWRA